MVALLGCKTDPFVPSSLQYQSSFGAGWNEIRIISASSGMSFSEILGAGRSVRSRNRTFAQCSQVTKPDGVLSLWIVERTISCNSGVPFRKKYCITWHERPYNPYTVMIALKTYHCASDSLATDFEDLIYILKAP